MLNLIYKEWLKMRWAVAGSFLICAALLINMLLKINFILEQHSATALWNSVIFKSYKYYGDFLYIPVLIWIIIAVSQFYPEIVNKKFKLHLHLPVKEVTLVTVIIIYGWLIGAIINLITFICIAVVTFYNFPTEIFYSLVANYIPWFIGGSVIYLAIAAVFIEPKWKNKIVIFIISFGLVKLLLEETTTGAYNNLLPYMWIFLIPFFTTVFHSVYRFKRGM